MGQSAVIDTTTHTPLPVRMKTSILLSCLVCVSVTTAQRPDKNCIKCLHYCAKDPSPSACNDCVKMGCQPSANKSCITVIPRWSASMSSGIHGNPGKYPAKNCIDDDVNTICHTHGGESWPWVAVEIPSSDVYEVWIVNRNDCCGERTRNLKVWVGDKYPTTASSEYSSGKLLGNFHGPGTNGQVIKVQSEQGTGLKGNIVILQMSKTDVINLAEIYVFGSKDY